MGDTTYTRQTLPAGRYAIIWPGNGQTYFFRVDVGTGRWAGTRFISRQAGDEFYPVPPKGRAAAYDLILADPMAALTLYGQQIGRCGRCGRTLTNETSRAAGIGPICAESF